MFPSAVPRFQFVQNPTWEADSRSATQEIDRILWNPVHRSVYKKPNPPPPHKKTLTWDMWRFPFSNSFFSC